MNKFAQVVVDVPVAHALDYRVDEKWADSTAQAQVGCLCVVPVGRRRQIGIVVGLSEQSSLAPARLRSLEAVLPMAPLSQHWLALCRFAAEYYHFGWGEMALPALPPLLRRLPAARKRRAAAARESEGRSQAPAPVLPEVAPLLRAEQQIAIDEITHATEFASFLLFGITGSGKTEVYLGAIERLLERNGQAQALLLVPEINLTPQLHARLRARFPGYGVISLHSALAPRERADSWLLAHEGRAQIILGTRTAVFASLPNLRMIVVDEEHDASFKSHGGAPFSARDLAVKRAQLEAIPVILGSATPSLESWQQALSGRYRLLNLQQRASTGGADPVIETVDLRQFPPVHGLSAPLRDALEQTLTRAEQALVFLNRRGFAPVLRCAACEWLSKCPRCDAFAAYHKVGARLRCHHCGWNAAVPAACPDCGNQDLQGVGQGTQRIEESLCRLWPKARIARIDRDSTQGVRGANRATQAFDAVHAGEVDILVGTQMITKGHDFRRVSTVCVLNADAQLVAADFRAPERLFAVLMQVAGRAGRAGQQSRVLIQTRYARHPLFAALARQNFPDFAQEQLAERRAARMPPFVHQALLTCTARTIEQALQFLRTCADLPTGQAPGGTTRLYDPVPMPLARMASESRGQLLIEAPRRADLHALLSRWLPQVRALGSRGILRWSIEVDPQAI